MAFTGQYVAYMQVIKEKLGAGEMAQALRILALQPREPEFKSQNLLWVAEDKDSQDA